MAIFNSYVSLLDGITYGTYGKRNNRESQIAGTIVALVNMENKQIVADKIFFPYTDTKYSMNEYVE